jgi:hypothetical protein
LRHRRRNIFLAVAALALVSFVPAGASDDAGLTPLGPYRGWIGVVTLSPSFGSDGLAWVAPVGGRIFASSNAGASWQPSHEGETDPDVTSIAASPTVESDHTVFAAADDGIFKSTDGGRTWINVSTGPIHGHSCRIVAVSPRFASDGVVLAATDSGVFRSSDGGVTWLPPANYAVPLISLAIAGRASGDPSTLYAGLSSGGLIESSDGGDSWSPDSAFPDARTALDIVASPAYATDYTVFAGTDDGVWESSVPRSAWNRAGIGGQRIPAVAVSPAFANDRTVFAGSASGGGVYASSDGGASWNATALGAAFVESIAISRDFERDRTLFAGLAGSGVEVSTDAGASWLPSNTGLHAAQVIRLRLSGSRLGMAGIGGASFRPAASGSWTDYSVPTTFVSAYGAAGQDVFVGTENDGLTISHNLGRTWAWPSLPDGPVSYLGLSPRYAADGVVLAADRFVYMSRDRGRDWKQATGILGTDVQRFAFSPNFGRDHVIFAATTGHLVRRSTDGGLTWRDASSGLPSAQINDVILSPQYSADHTLYAATTGFGIFRSDDDGESWSSLVPQVPDRVVSAFAWGRDGSLIAGTQKGIYQITAAGWSTLTGGWDDFVTDLDRSGSTLFVGTAGDGVWTLALPATVTATATSTATDSAVRTTTTSSPTATATPAATPTSTSPSRPSAHKLHPHVQVIPSPMAEGRPALVRIQGPGNGTVSLTLTSGGWRRSYRARLASDGRAAFGFVAPRGTMTLVATVKGKAQTATVRLTVHAVAARFA